MAGFCHQQATAQTFTVYTSQEGTYLQKAKATAGKNAKGEVALSADKGKAGETFKAWGTCMNELDWDALQALSDGDRERLLDLLFTPEGLGYTMGRIPMNANDYARSWYSCDEVDGDFQLKYFNIDRDRTAVIPLIKAAQERCPQMTFWASPWSPPSWMKINHHYAVQSSKWNDLDTKKDYLLFGDGDRSDNEQVKPDPRFFPRRMAVQDFLIQEPRYLQAYADYFCRFIDEYRSEGIDIAMVMYQNEAYSYTAYPGCPWTTEGIKRFNLEYLWPTLQKKQPQVKLWLGTFNTNRLDHISDVLADGRWEKTIGGLGFQWEGRQTMRQLHERFPQYEFMSTESECGWGDFSWNAAEHTFELMTDYLGLGCTRYTFWNAILCGDGVSTWGWKQNALVRVDSTAKSYTLTPEFYAVWHFAHFLRPGSKIVAHHTATKEQPWNALIATNPNGKWTVTVNNPADGDRTITLQLGKKYLNVTAKAHTFYTFVEK